MMFKFLGLAALAAAESATWYDEASENLSAELEDLGRMLSSHNATTTGSDTGGSKNTTATTDTTTTDTTTGATKVEIKGTVGMTIDTPATCDTTAEMASTACDAVRGALEGGICEAIKSKQTTANQAHITCSGASKNFAAVMTLSRRLEENKRNLAAKTISASYTLTVRVSTAAAGNTFADAVIAAQPTAAEVKTAIETAVTAGNVAGLTITSVDSVSTPTKAVTTSVEAFAIHSAVASLFLMGASLMF